MTDGKKIVIIEDEASLLNPLVDKFREEGYIVYGESNGSNGLERIKIINPDMVLLDLVMPKMDGLTMLQILRADPNIQHTRVIVLSNLSDVEKASKAAALGSLDYIVKSDWKIKDIVIRVAEKIV